MPQNNPSADLVSPQPCKSVPHICVASVMLAVQSHAVYRCNHGNGLTRSSIKRLCTMQASLKALQVLLERTTPSANSLIRRLPPEVPPHGHVALLIDYINNPDATQLPTISRPWGNQHTTTAESAQSSVFPGVQSGMSGDLRTSEVLFALDSATGPVPPGASSFQHSDGAATLSDHNTMTDSVALSAAAPSAHMSGARISASQIPENDEIWNLDQPIALTSSMPVMSNTSSIGGKPWYHLPTSGQLGLRPHSIGKSSVASASTHLHHGPASTGISTNASMHAHAPSMSADGSIGNPADLPRPPVSSQASETNDSRLELHSARNSLRDPGIPTPLAPGACSMHANAHGDPDNHPQLTPSSIGVTDGPPSLPMSQIPESPPLRLPSTVATAAGSSVAGTVVSTGASAMGNAGSFTTQASVRDDFTVATSVATMAPHSGQSIPAVPAPNFSSFMPSTADTIRGFMPSTQGSIPGPVSDMSLPAPGSQGHIRRPSSASSLQVHPLSVCLTVYEVVPCFHL